MREIVIFLLWLVAWGFCIFFTAPVVHWALQWWKHMPDDERKGS